MGGLDGLFTSDEERAKAELSLNHQLQQPHILQALANIEEAKHPSVFVSGWRPALGWICVFILAWTWIVRDVVIIGLMLVDKSEVVQQLPTTDTSTVITLLLCLLGLGGARTIEKALLKNSTISSVIQWIAATTTAGIIAFAIKQLF